MFRVVSSKSFHKGQFSSLLFKRNNTSHLQAPRNVIPPGKVQSQQADEEIFKHNRFINLQGAKNLEVYDKELDKAKSVEEANFKERKEARFKQAQLAYSKQKEVEAIMREQKLKRKNESIRRKKEHLENLANSRQQFLEIMNQDVKYWLRTPAELTYRRYKFDPNSNLHEKLQKWISNNLRPTLS